MFSSCLSLLILLFICSCTAVLRPPTERVQAEIKEGWTTPPVYKPQPEQVHLNYGLSPTEMIVTWQTNNLTDSSIAQYGQGSPLRLSENASGVATTFIDGGPEKRHRYIHRVTMKVQPGKAYFYRVGSPDGWSSIFYFIAKSADPNWAPSGIIFGDMGNTNAHSLPRIQTHAQKLEVDTIFHIGDFAYNMFEHNGDTGDEFMRQIEPAAAYVAYMTCPGNHENMYNFSNYRNRFSMAGGSKDSSFHSFDWGFARVIMFTTEPYFFQHDMIEPQYRWLESELQKASADRANHPWIITMAHRPMYCSSKDDYDCTFRESFIRTGLPPMHSFALEPLFYKYGVDLMFWAHAHSYERLLPVYNLTIPEPENPADPYANARAPIHITTGSAGCREYHSNFGEMKPWDVVRSTDYGFATISIPNRTHIHVMQISDDKGGQAVDDFWVSKHDPQGIPAWLQPNVHFEGHDEYGKKKMMDLPGY